MENPFPLKAFKLSEKKGRTQIRCLSLRGKLKLLCLNLSSRMASLNLQSVAKCCHILTHRFSRVSFRVWLSNSYLATIADFWGFNSFWRRSTIVSYVRESSLNNIGATKSFASWYVSVGRLANRTTFSCFESVTPLVTKKISAVLHTLRSQFPIRTSKLLPCLEPDLVPRLSRLLS